MHILLKPLYLDDARRHFIGNVGDCEGALIRVNGYLYAVNESSKQFVKRDTLRTRLISLNSENIIVSWLPDTVAIEKIAYQYRSANDILVTDGSDWNFNLTHL